MKFTSINHISALFLTVLAAILVFSHTLGGEFVYDDRVLIELNPQMHGSDIWTAAFSSPYWELVDKERYAAGFYRPLAAIVFAATYQLGGENPLLFHIISLLIHAGCALMVFHICHTLTHQLRPSLLAGFFFAVMGSHSEAVAWISAQPDLTATLFALLGVKFWIKNQLNRSTLFFFLSLLCKESAIGIVALFFIFSIRKKQNIIPFIIFLATYYFLRVQAFDWNFWAGFDRENTNHQISILQEITLSLQLFGNHLIFMAFPVDHAPFHPLILKSSLTNLKTLAPIATTFIAIFIAIKSLKKEKGTLTVEKLGVWIVLLGLLPVLSTKSLGQYPFEERFSYLASTGFALLISSLLAKTALRKSSWLIIPILLTGNAYSAVNGSRPWRTEADLFRWAQEVSPLAMTGHIEFGRLMLEYAQNSKEPKQKFAYAELALESYQKTDDINVDEVFCTTIERYKANIGKGDALFLMGDISSSKKIYQLAIEHYTHAPEALLGLGNCLAQEAFSDWSKGLVSNAKGKYVYAVEAYKKSLEQKDNLPASIMGLSKALVMIVNIEGVKSSLFQEALKACEDAYKSFPNDFPILLNLIAMYDANNERKKAIGPISNFIKNNPNHSEIKTLMELQSEFKLSLR